MRFAAGMGATAALVAGALLTAGPAMAAGDGTDFARGGAFPDKPEKSDGPAPDTGIGGSSVGTTQGPMDKSPDPDTAKPETPLPELPEGEASGLRVGGAGSFNVPTGAGGGRPMPRADKE